MFVTFYFHDNDFTDPIRKAMKALDLEYRLRDFSQRPEQIKEAVCILATGFAQARALMNWNTVGKSHLEYFRAHGKVEFTRDTPENGGNGSAVSIDLNTHYIWIH
jgi:hypothetical protein